MGSSSVRSMPRSRLSESKGSGRVRCSILEWLIKLEAGRVRWHLMYLVVCLTDLLVACLATFHVSCSARGDNGGGKALGAANLFRPSCDWRLRLPSCSFIHSTTDEVSLPPYAKPPSTSIFQQGVMRYMTSGSNWRGNHQSQSYLLGTIRVRADICWPLLLQIYDSRFSAHVPP